MLGFSLRVFAKKFGGGEFDNVVIAIHNVGSAGDFNSGKTMTNGESDFLSEEAGVRCDNGGADDAVSFVGNEFDEAVVEIMSFAGSHFI